MWCWCQCQKCLMTKNIHITPHFNHLDLANVFVLFMMQSASCDARTGTNGITSPKTSCCTFKLRNAVVPLTIHHVEVVLFRRFHITKKVTFYLTLIIIILTLWMYWCHLWCLWQPVTKKSCWTSSPSSWPNKCDGAIDDAISVMCPWHHNHKRSCCFSFWLLWPNKRNSAIDDAIGIT